MLTEDGGTTSATHWGKPPMPPNGRLCLGLGLMLKSPRARQVGVSEGTGHGRRVPACQVWTLKPRDMAHNVVEGCREGRGKPLLRPSDPSAIAAIVATVAIVAIAAKSAPVVGWLGLAGPEGYQRVRHCMGYRPHYSQSRGYSR